MHIEPGVVDGAKIVLSYATAAGAFAYAAKLSLNTIRKDGIIPLGIRTVIAAFLVFFFFQILPHYPVGVSEVHFILGATLFLMFGAAPAAFGLALGLLGQGLLFVPRVWPASEILPPLMRSGSVGLVLPYYTGCWLMLWRRSSAV